MCVFFQNFDLTYRDTSRIEGRIFLFIPHSLFGVSQQPTCLDDKSACYFTHKGVALLAVVLLTFPILSSESFKQAFTIRSMTGSLSNGIFVQKM